MKMMRISAVSVALSWTLFQIGCLENAAAFQSVQTSRSASSMTVLQASSKEQPESGHASTTTLSSPSPFLDRNHFLLGLGNAVVASIGFPAVGQAISYSENAANLERINSGDFSGGAVFNNNPTTEGAKKRRAMTGCKTPIAREEAAQTMLKQKSLGEKECNTMVMGGDTEFMLQALRNLDCPTCPNGIASSRP